MKIEIEKLFVLTCGEKDILSGELCAEGINQSKIIGAKIASITGTKTANVFFSNYNDDEPIKDTSGIVFSKVQEKSRLVFPVYINSRKMDNIWEILDEIYSLQCNVVILVMCPSSINRLMRYFCEDNNISLPSPSDQTIGHCRGYEIDCINKKCTSIDWSRAVENSQAACPY